MIKEKSLAKKIHHTNGLVYFVGDVSSATGI
jgi:hypothetical protein